MASSEYLIAPGPCFACGHDPSCGFASVTVGDETRWLCHTDDHSCYAEAAYEGSCDD